MDRRWQYGTALRVVSFAALAGVMGWSVFSVAQAPAPAAKTVPDAQVEANVLKALAAAPDLANQPISTTTVYGVVTITGSVQTEAQRTEAENIASRASGVQKVVDELTLAGEAAAAPAGGGVLQSDGTMAPPDSNNTAPNQAAGPGPGQPGAPNYGPGPGTGAPEYSQQQQQQYPGGYGPPPNYGADQNGAAPNGAAPAQGYPQQPQGYPQQGQGYPHQPGYPQQQPGYPPPQPGYGPPQQQGYAPQPGYNTAPAYAGQQAGEVVTVPGGALVRIRINQTLDSAKAKAGEKFDGVVINDVPGGGAVAIPRGAMVQGIVVDAKKSGALAGRGELSLQLTQVTLGGKTYPIVSDVWAHNGADKTVQTVNSAAVGGGVGALIGAAAGGGAGAAIGAGVGGLLGLGSSAASHTGQVFVPSEGLLTFHLAQPATLATVSQAEMDRMAQGIPGGGPPQMQRRYPPGYYGPAYYRPYPYPY
jgi:hypothetical protein